MNTIIGLIASAIAFCGEKGGKEIIVVIIIAVILLALLGSLG